MAEDATNKDDAWRHDIAAFGKEVVAVAAKSQMPDNFQLLQSIRSRFVFQDKSGQPIRVILRESFTNELHGELVKRFTGSVSWKGEVDKTEIDEKEKRHVIDVKFPVPPDTPKPLTFRDTVRLEIPFTELPQDKVPAKGTEFAFTGTLKKAKADALDEPIWVLYGVGSSSGTAYVGVSLIDVRPSAKSK
jgi:hypothetical protein